VQVVGETGVAYQVPADPVATLLLFHGCGHSATDFFPPTFACPHCAGLPEEVAIARAALARRWAVIALSSVDRTRKCWGHADQVSVRAALEHVRAAESLPAAPLFGLGASSGGFFVMSLACSIDFAAISPQIAALPWTTLHRCVLRGRYPPTAFVHMPRDARTATAVAAAVKVLGGGRG